MDINLLPESIAKSGTFTSNELQQLSSVTEIPFIDATFTDDKLKSIFQYYALNPPIWNKNCTAMPKNY